MPQQVRLNCVLRRNTLRGALSFARPTFRDFHSPVPPPLSTPPPTNGTLAVPAGEAGCLLWMFSGAGSSATIDWMGPFAVPLFFGASRGTREPRLQLGDRLVRGIPCWHPRCAYTSSVRGGGVISASIRWSISLLAVTPPFGRHFPLAHEWYTPRWFQAPVDGHLRRGAPASGAG